MLRGSEVSKDSYHSPVKKIKTIKNLQTESHQQWTMAVVLQLTTCSGKLFQAFTFRHANELGCDIQMNCMSICIALADIDKVRIVTSNWFSSNCRLCASVVQSGSTIEEESSWGAGNSGGLPLCGWVPATCFWQPRLPGTCHVRHTDTHRWSQYLICLYIEVDKVSVFI